MWKIVLYIDLRPGQTCHSKVMHRKEVTHSDGSYEKKSRRRAWLKKWDRVKSHGTLIDWCIGREWPVNCMTVISAWWRSNMPFQRLSGRLNYYITRCRQEVRWVGNQMSWSKDVVRKATTQQKGPSGPLSEFGDPLVTRCGRESQHSAESWAPGPPVEQQWRTRKTQRWWP